MDALGETISPWRTPRWYSFWWMMEMWEREMMWWCFFSQTVSVMRFQTKQDDGEIPIDLIDSREEIHEYCLEEHTIGENGEVRGTEMYKCNSTHQVTKNILFVPIMIFSNTYHYSNKGCVIIKWTFLTNMKLHLFNFCNEIDTLLTLTPI